MCSESCKEAENAKKPGDSKLEAEKRGYFLAHIFSESLECPLSNGREEDDLQTF
jgi:hypothetical protein